jgi:hypothetical protein
MIFDRIVGLVAALATLGAVFFAWRAAKAAEASVRIAERAAVAAEQSVTMAQRARREERAAQRIRQLQRVGEALSRVQSTGDAAALSAFPSGVPVGVTEAEAIVMAPVITVHTAFRRAIGELRLALVGVPEDLATCRRIVVQEGTPAATKALLPTATSEVTEALKAAWAELKRLEE